MPKMCTGDSRGSRRRPPMLDTSSAPTHRRCSNQTPRWRPAQAERPLNRRPKTQEFCDRQTMTETIPTWRKVASLLLAKFRVSRSCPQDVRSGRVKHRRRPAFPVAATDRLPTRRGHTGGALWRLRAVLPPQLDDLDVGYQGRGAYPHSRATEPAWLRGSDRSARSTSSDGAIRCSIVLRQMRRGDRRR